MNSNKNLEKEQHKCRICFKSGDVNILNCKIAIKQTEVNEINYCIDNFIEKSFAEIMDIFLNSQELVILTQEYPLLCWQCLEDLKFCYTIYEKIKLAKIQLTNLYRESLSQYVEEEHLIEVIDENDLNDIIETNLNDTLEEEKILNIQQHESDTTNEVSIFNKSSRSKQIAIDNSDSFIVTQFIPEILEAKQRSSNQSKDDEVMQSPQHTLTVSLKAVEVKDVRNIDTLKSCYSSFTENSDSAIYICQYCPQAFAKSDYLQTHIQKSHVCKFCTQPFNVTEDLFKHIREVHTENKCAICQKTLSSRTNLRHHIKRVHRIELPAKVTLIDFIKSPPAEENEKINEAEILQELEENNIQLNTQYVWTNDQCIEMLNENDLNS